MNNNKKCPFCGEMIDVNATICPVCAEDISIEVEPSKINCPYCGEEILPTAKKCKYCKNWLNGNSNNKYSNNYAPTIFGIIGSILFIAMLFGIFTGTTDNYTTDNWLRGCEQGKEYLGDFGIGVYKDYKCKNKSYTDVKEASMTTLGLNSSFEVHENGNPVGYIHYDYNFHQYNCAYVWAQEESSCNLSEFVSNLRKYEDYKKNKEQKSVTNSQDISSKPTLQSTVTPIAQKPIKSEELSTSNVKKATKPNNQPVYKSEKLPMPVNPAPPVAKSDYKKADSTIQNLRETDFGPYMRELKSRTQINWTPPQTPYSVKVVVLLKIAKNGKLLASKIQKSSGIPEVDTSALKAVEITAPFRPLPVDYTGESVEIQLTLNQNAYINGEKVLPPEY